VTERHRLSVTVNGEPVEADVESRRMLADFLREDLGLTGTKQGCEHGVCGACTVLLDGEAVRSCILFAVQADGAQVETVEALAVEGRLSALQEAFAEHHALQCGFCTPGFLISARAFLAEHPSPTEAEVRAGLAGNICRCTGYQGIVEAVMAVSHPGGREEERA
jgi:aerobic-type carbon monoxide dehydrogenase small subunit (CoxS/CutS family)